jgi:hypothetical protein
VLPQPIIVVPLTNLTVGLGSTVPFAVTVFGQPPLNYSWQYNGTTLTNGGQISGTTTNTLVLTGATTNNDGTYEVTVTNAFGSTNSSAILTVLTAPVITLTVVSNNFSDGLKFNILGGSNGGPFHAYYTTNLLMPFTNPFGNASFGSLGQFSQQIIGLTNPQAFFILTQP